MRFVNFRGTREKLEPGNQGISHRKPCHKGSPNNFRVCCALRLQLRVSPERLRRKRRNGTSRAENKHNIPSAASNTLAILKSWYGDSLRAREFKHVAMQTGNGRVEVFGGKRPTLFGEVAAHAWAKCGERRASSIADCLGLVIRKVTPSLVGKSTGVVARIRVGWRVSQDLYGCQRNIL